MRAGRPQFTVIRGGEPPPASSSVLRRLLEAVRTKASGELLCANPEGEVHIYLQGGRIAWATHSKHRRVFTQHLKQSAGIDESAIEAVVAECRASGRPIGETLVAWKLATQDQVRGALRHQIEQALQATEAPGECQAVFLQRDQYGRYDPSLTFPLAELRPELQPGSDENAPEAAHADGPWPDPSVAGAAAADGGLGGRETHALLVDALQALRGLEGFRDAAVLEPSGDQLASPDGRAYHPCAAYHLANAVLVSAQETSHRLGIGRGLQVHVETDRVHLLVNCINEGFGAARVHLLLILAREAPIGLARLKLEVVGERLAEALRDGAELPRGAGLA